MKDQDLDHKFSWTVLLLVTGVCFLLFCATLKMLGDSYSPIFFRVGLASVILGVLCGLVSLLPSPAMEDSSQVVDE
jgi:hypothetical protein